MLPVSRIAREWAILLVGVPLVIGPLVAIGETARSGGWALVGALTYRTAMVMLTWSENTVAAVIALALLRPWRLPIVVVLALAVFVSRPLLYSTNAGIAEQMHGWLLPQMPWVPLSDRPSVTELDWLRYTVQSAITYVGSVLVLHRFFGLGLFWGRPATTRDAIAEPLAAVPHQDRLPARADPVMADLAMADPPVADPTAAGPTGAPHPAAPMLAPAVPAAPCLAKLPDALRGELWAVSAEGHYLRIVTAKGSALVLHRLGDAVTELSRVPGAQVHRSHWVARAGVAELRRKPDGSPALLLRNGTEIPVSRSYRAAAEAAGLLAPDRADLQFAS